jgi:hypothetical protein
VLKGPYLGQKPPGIKPEIFAPGIISTSSYEHSSVTFSPDGNEVYWSKFLYNHSFQVIMFMERKNGEWTKPKMAPFCGQYRDGEPFLSPDGKKLFFLSYRPPQGTGEPKEDRDIWFVERADNEWNVPKHLGNVVNSNAQEYYVSVTSNGTIYFGSRREGGKGSNDIYRSEFLDGSYMKPENLGGAINSEFSDNLPYIAPDESYLIFYSSGRSDDYGDGDLYISYRKKNGSWTKAKNMTERINSNTASNSPIVSPDGKYLFFNDYKRIKYDHFFETRLSYRKLAEKYRLLPGNELGDIYWVNARIIEELKPSGLE